MDRLEFKEGLPVPEPIIYTAESRDLAVVIPLFQGLTYNEKEIDCFVQTSLAARHSIVANSDVVERGIPVYFFVEDIVYDRLAVPIIDSGIPPELVLKFSSLPPMSESVRGYLAKKLMVLDDLTLGEYQSFIVIDADMFICRKSFGEKFRWEALEGENIGAWGFGRTDDCWQDVPHYWDKYHTISEASEQFHKSCETLNTLTSLDINEDTTFKNTSGGLLRFVNPLPDGFKDFVLKVMPAALDDELVFALWKLYNPDADIDRLGLNNEMETKFDGQSKHTLSLIHISEPTRLLSISYAVFCLKKKKSHT